MADNFSIAQELIRGGITFASVIAGAWVALRNHRSNQWWNARHAAYEKAIELLDKINHALFKYSFLSEQPTTPPLPVSQSDIMKAGDECQNLYAELESLISRSQFNMSPEAIGILNDASVYVLNMMKEKSLREENKHYPTIPVIRALNALCEEAKNDLQITPLYDKFRSSLSDFWIGISEWFLRFFGPVTRKAHLSAWVLWLGEEKGKRGYQDFLQRMHRGQPPIEKWWVDQDTTPGSSDTSDTSAISAGGV